MNTKNRKEKVPSKCENYYEVIAKPRRAEAISSKIGLRKSVSGHRKGEGPGSRTAPT